MQHKDNKSTRHAIGIVAVAVLTAFVGVALSAQMGPRRGPGAPLPPDGAEMAWGQGPGFGPGFGPGQPGMRGMGPGMRGRPGLRGQGPMGGPMGLMGIGLRELDLTDAQRDQIKGLVESHRESHKATAETLLKARKDLHDAITSGTADEAAIRAKAAEVAKIEADAAVARGQLHSQLFQVLTPEQQQKAQELRSAREKRLQEGRERMKQRMEQRREPRKEQLLPRSDRESGGPHAV